MIGVYRNVIFVKIGILGVNAEKVRGVNRRREGDSKEKSRKKKCRLPTKNLGQFSREIKYSEWVIQRFYWRKSGKKIGGRKDWF